MENPEKDYEIYLEKYSIKHKIPKEEAKEHQLLKDVKKYYEEESHGKYETCGI